MSRTKNRSPRDPRVRVARRPAGVLDVLSVGRGHLKLTITPGDEVETAKARAVIEDMLARGASIFVEMPDGSTKRVKRFDPKKMIYYVDPPEVLPPPPVPTAAAVPVPVAAAAKQHRGRYAPMPVAGSRATAVGRTAGG